MGVDLTEIKRLERLRWFVTYLYVMVIIVILFVCVPSTDIESKSNSSTPAEGQRAEKPHWTCSDNTFRFNFFPDKSPELQDKTSPPDRTEPSTSRISFTKQDRASALNFQIPLVTSVEDMETTEAPDSSSSSSQQCVQEENLNSPPEPLVQTKSKKKKKSGKKKVPDNIEPQQKPAEESKGGEDTVLVSVKLFFFKFITVGAFRLFNLMSECDCVFQSAEEQLNRQLDWCIEQLELGMRSQKATPKQSMMFPSHSI